MTDTSVSEIRINAFDNIYYTKAGVPAKLGFQFESNLQLVSFLNTIEPSLSSWEDSRTIRSSQGYFFSIVSRSTTPEGNTAVIMRRPRQALPTEDELLSANFLTPSMATFLRLLARTRLSGIISNQTGTSSLVESLFLRNLNPLDRTVVVEPIASVQTNELDTNLIHMVADLGGLEYATLLKRTLSLTPDTLCAFNLRLREEFATAFEIANSGTRVLCSYHGEDPQSTFIRYLSNLVGTSNLPIEFANHMLAETFGFIVCTRRFPDGSRRISHITEIVGVSENDPKKLILNSIYQFSIKEVTEDGYVIGDYVRSSSISPRLVSEFRKAGIPESIYARFTETVNNIDDNNH